MTGCYFLGLEVLEVFETCCLVNSLEAKADPVQSIKPMEFWVKETDDLSLLTAMPVALKQQKKCVKSFKLIITKKTYIIQTMSVLWFEISWLNRST